MFPADIQSGKADVDGRTHPEEMVKRTIQPNAARNPRFSFDPEKHITIKNTVGNSYMLWELIDNTVSVLSFFSLHVIL